MQVENLICNGVNASLPTSAVYDMGRRYFQAQVSLSSVSNCANSCNRQKLPFVKVTAKESVNREVPISVQCYYE